VRVLIDVFSHLHVRALTTRLKKYTHQQFRQLLSSIINLYMYFTKYTCSAY